MVTIARNKIMPIAIPTEPAVVMPLFELDGPVVDGVEVDEVWVELLRVDEGELLPRQLASLELSTFMIFELPPWCP